jgi:hypothetical protein
MTAEYRRFAYQLLAFLAPYLLAVLVFAAIGIVSGELVPARWVARLQTADRPFLYLPKFSDHNYTLKLAASRAKAPDILVLGASRANQWRSAMFGASFYNAAQSVYTIRDYGRFVRELGPNVPKVLILSIDYFLFHPDWSSSFGAVADKDLNPFDPAQATLIGWDMVGEVMRNPAALFRLPREPIYGVPAVGLQASEAGRGFRIDGSFQYGDILRGDASKGVSVEQAVERVRLPKAPFLPGASINAIEKQQLAEFLQLCRSKGIAVIGVAMPYLPKVVEALDSSPQHGIWAEFRSPPFRDWAAAQGMLYFDFSDIKSFGGTDAEFVDAFHASEPAYIRMLLEMAGNPKANALLKVNIERLKQRLAGSSTFEAFRNDFAGKNAAP